MSQKQTLVLIDGHSVVFRAYYAIPYLTSPTGNQVNAVYGFGLILLNVINDLNPSHIAVTFDTSAPTFRHTDFTDYKAHRKETPPELHAQIEPVHQLVQALNIPIFEVDGFEADDVIGTLSTQATHIDNLQTLIVTGDQDQFQLVIDNKVLVHIPGRNKHPAKTYSETDVLHKMGVTTHQIADYKGLAGDSSDNIPGIKGIGPKTAVNIIKEFDNIEAVYDFLLSPDSLESSSRQAATNLISYTPTAQHRLKKAGISQSVLSKLLSGREIALQSKQLATIITDVPIKLDLDACKVSGYDKDEVIKLFDELGFKSLVRKLPADEFELSVQDSLF